MTNWAIVIDGAVIAAIGTVARGVGASGGAGSFLPAPRDFAVFAGAAIAWLFTTRFVVRAILCYINLGRWNTIQLDVVRAYALGRGVDSSALSVLEESIRNYYIEWRSPYTRPAQLLHNFKLGFGFLLLLPLPIIVWGAAALWSASLVRGIVVFVVIVTGVELWDFLGSSFFDDVRAAARRNIRDSQPTAPNKLSIFPLAPPRWGYIIGLVVATLAGSALAAWPALHTLITKP